MFYKWSIRSFNLIIGLALLFSFLSINFVSAGSVIYDDPSVPRTTIPSSGGTTYVNNSFTNITNIYISINQTNNYTNNESLWNYSTNPAGQITLHPANLTPNVGIGTNDSFYDLEVRNTDGNNSAIGISSGTGNSNASLFFRETDAVRYKIFYDGLLSVFQIYSFALDKSVLSFNVAGDATFSQNVIILGNLTAPNICYSNGTGCNSTGITTLNDTLGDSFTYVNGTIGYINMTSFDSRYLSGGYKSFYFTNHSSDIAGMYNTTRYLSELHSLNSITVSSGDGETLIAQFISPLEPSYIVAPGLRRFSLEAKVSSTAKKVQLKALIYIVNSTGGQQILLRNSTVSIPLTTLMAEYSMTSIGDVRYINDTSRILFQIYSVKEVGGPNIGTTIYLEDDTFSRLDVPSPVGVTDISGLIPYTGATENIDLENNNVTIDGNLNVGSNTNLTTLNVSNQANFGGNVSIAHKLSTKSLYVSNNIYSDGNLYAYGNVSITNTKGNNVTLNNFVEHTQEMMTDTLLDKSFSTLSVVGGQLNYTLYAFYGCGQFNFNGILYPITGSPCVNNATITLTKGTDINPITNYIYWELVGGVPTMKTASTYPTSDHIDVATFVVGSVTGTTANIYSYSRNRYEVDTFVKRVIERFEESGTLYISGFDPAVNTTQLNITSGGEFFNGIFEMTSTNMVRLSEGFYYINATGNFVQATSLSSFTQYSDGTAFAIGHERVNIIWGLVPVNTTGEVGPTQMRLVAILPNKPNVVYNSIAEAITDNYDTTNYFPPNSEIKNVFVPIARTILRPSTDLFEQFSTGRYYQDIRGKITSGGGSAASTPTYWALSGNTLGTTTGTYQVKVNELLINNTNGLYNALSAHGNLNNYYQMNIKNTNNGSYASSDIVATANNGNETSTYIDMGINSANYSDPDYTIMGKNDGYLYVRDGNLAIGTGTINKIIRFFVGGTLITNEEANITTSGLTVKNNISAKWVKGLFNWVSANNWNTFNGSTLTFNETKLNSTIDSEGVRAGFNSTFNDTYAQYAYNQSFNLTWLFNYTVGGNISVCTAGGAEEGLVGHWKMNDNAGNTLVYDNIKYNNVTMPANTNTRSIAGATVNTNTALDFQSDRGTTVGNAGADVSGANPRTIAFWGRTDSTTAMQTFISMGFGTTQRMFALMLLDVGDGHDHYYFAGYSADLDTGVTVDTNWHHHIVTYDGTNVTWYLDNVSIGSKTLALTTDNLPIYFGDRQLNDAKLNGALDDVRIYNKSLNLAERSALYNSTYGTELDSGESVCYNITGNNTLDFGNTTLLANGFNVHSEYYTGDAVNVISKIKPEDTKATADFTKIDHATIGGAMEIRAGQVTQSLDKSIAIMLKAVQQLIEQISGIDIRVSKIENNITILNDKIIQLESDNDKFKQELCDLGTKGSWCK